ncbi:MAG TPA: OmpH family outer membrane protein [Puia sp.]|nr:OmpH family outer membrane protein [Puia sp.]
MKKIVSVIAVAFVAVLATNQVNAQTKIGYVNLGELISVMPESKKADTAFNDFRNSLQQQLLEYQNEYYEADSVLKSRDTVKFTKPQLEVKKRNLLDLQIKLQGFNEQAQQQMQQKQQDLLAPIQKKAVDAVQTVAKENGYTYILSKEVLYASPAADDITPLVRKKLGIK